MGPKDIRIYNGARNFFTPFKQRDDLKGLSRFLFAGSVIFLPFAASLYEHLKAPPPETPQSPSPRTVRQLHPAQSASNTSPFPSLTMADYTLPTVPTNSVDAQLLRNAREPFDRALEELRHPWPGYPRIGPDPLNVPFFHTTTTNL